MKNSLCPCGSQEAYAMCCKSFLLSLGLVNSNDTLTLTEEFSQTLLLDWIYRYSPPITQTFIRKARPYIFRISKYLDSIIDMYLHLEYPNDVDDKFSPQFVSMKHNVLLSLLTAVRCLSEGLFIQSGILLRSAVEDCFCLIDFVVNKEQFHKFLQNKYKSSNALARIRKHIPMDLIRWYAQLSANFTHLGPLHASPYQQHICWADNWVLVAGIQNLVRAVVSYHIVLERIYLPNVEVPWFWIIEENKNPVFNNDSKVFEWTTLLGKDIVRQYPPDERQEGFVYSDETVTLK